MEAPLMITVPRLHEYRRVRITLREQSSPDIMQLHPFSDMPSRVLYRRVPIDIGQLSQAEPRGIVSRIREPIHYHRRRLTVKNLTHSTVQLVVGDGGPVTRLLISHRCHILRAAYVHGHHGVGRWGLAILRAVFGWRVSRWWCLRQAIVASVGIVIVIVGCVDGTGYGAVRGDRRVVATAAVDVGAIATSSTDTATRVEVVGIVGHVLGHGRLAVLLEGDGQPAWCEFRVSGYEDRWQDWTLHSLVMIRVDADFLLFGGEGILTDVQGFELVVGLEIWPAPDSTVDHVGQAFAVGYL